MASSQLRAIQKGWQGVWEQAKFIGTHGSSGGVAILVRTPIIAMRGNEDYDHRGHRVMMQWTRTTKIHIVKF